MTPTQIRTKVQTDVTLYPPDNMTLRQYANIGNDTAIANAITEVIPTHARISYDVLFNIFKGKVVLNILDALRLKTGGAQPSGKKFTVLYELWMKDLGMDASELLDGTPTILDDLETEGVINASQKTKLVELAQKTVSLTVQEVSSALSIWRPGGVIAPIP